MSEDKQPDEDKKPELPPGWYDSPFDQYPGHIQFPYPLTYPQWKKWWKAAVEPLKQYKALDFDHWDGGWQGSKILILEYGSWDIEKVKNILMLQNLDTDEIIEHVRNDHKSEITIEKNSYAGKSVCFTGSIQSKINGSLITKKVAYEIAVSKGLLIKQGVVKKLDYLVLADVNSQSGKAKKARKYGVTLIAENAFWNMLGVQVE